MCSFLLILYILQSLFLFFAVSFSFENQRMFSQICTYTREYSPHEILHRPDLSHFKRFVPTFFRRVTNRRRHSIYNRCAMSGCQDRELLVWNENDQFLSLFKCHTNFQIFQVLLGSWLGLDFCFKGVHHPQFFSRR